MARRIVHCIQLMGAVCDEDLQSQRQGAQAERHLIICLAALSKTAIGRYASVDQFSEDILCYVQGRPVQHTAMPRSITR